MATDALTALALILLLGLVAQWLAARFKLPSILLLLLAGFAAGPVAGVLQPDLLFGGLLMPFVSISVGIILFEGGLSLRFTELREVGRTVRNLISVGIVVTWILASLASYWLLGFGLQLAILFGAILVVTGPTVILPLLQHIRPARQVAAVLKWEGILNDPVGAVLAVLVFEAIAPGHAEAAPVFILFGLAKTASVGILLSIVGAGLIVLFLKYHWVPESLHNSVSLTIVVVAFAASNALQHEAGLLTVTLMGVALANQQWVAVRHVVEFKENLRALLLSVLFIVLAARLDLEALSHLGWGSAVFVVALVIVVRPLAVLASAWRSELSWRELALVAWMAPRGVVAAAVTSVFALELSRRAYPGAEAMVPAMFLVITASVALYGLSAGPVSRRLGLSRPDPSGFVLVGADAFARLVGKALQNAGASVLLIDSNRRNIAEARMEGLPCHHGDALSEHLLDDLDLTDMNRLIALTPNDQVNALATLHFSDVFGRAGVYQLTPHTRKSKPDGDAMAQHLRGRLLFQRGLTYDRCRELLEAGAVVKTTALTREFDYDAFREAHDTEAVPLFIVQENGRIRVAADEESLVPVPGQKLISLVLENPGKIDKPRVRQSQ